MAMHDLVESLTSSELFEFIEMEFEVWCIMDLIYDVIEFLPNGWNMEIPTNN